MKTTKKLLMTLAMLPMLALALSGCHSHDTDDDTDFSDVGELRIDEKPRAVIAKQNMKAPVKLMTARKSPALTVQQHAGELDLE